MKKYEEMTMEELWADFTAPVEEANIQTIDNIPQEKINFETLFENQEQNAPVNQIQEQISHQQETPIELTHTEKAQNFVSKTEEQFAWTPNSFDSNKTENSINQSVESLEQKSEIQSVNKPVFNKISALREKYNSPEKENTPTVNQEVSQEKTKPTIEERIESRRDFMNQTHEKQMQEALGSGDKDKIENLKLQHEYETAQFDVSSQRRLAKEKGDPSLAPTNEQISKLNNAFSDFNEANPDAKYTDYFSKKSFEINDQHNQLSEQKTQNKSVQPRANDISVNDPRISLDEFIKDFNSTSQEKDIDKPHNYFDTFKEPDSNKTIKENMANAIEMNNVDKYEKGFYQAEQEMNRQHDIELNSATPKHSKINYEQKAFEFKRNMALHQKESFGHSEREKQLYSHPAPTNEQFEEVFNAWRDYKVKELNVDTINYDREPTKLELYNYEKDIENSNNKNFKGSTKQYETELINDQQDIALNQGFSQDQVFNATQQTFNKNPNISNISMASLSDKELQQVEQGQTPIGANQQLKQAMNNPIAKSQVQTQAFNEEFDRNFLAKEETLNPRKNKELEEQRLVEKGLQTSNEMSKEFTQGSQQPIQQQTPQQNTHNHNEDHIKKKKEFSMGFER